MSELYQSVLRRLAVLLGILLLGGGAYADEIQVEGAWLRATAAGRDSASVFMYVASKQDAKLVGASSPVSQSVELRTMLHKGGTMKTITVEAVPLPAGKRVDMTSIHSYHLTLTGLKAPLEAGTAVPLTLDIEMPGKPAVKVGVQAEVRPLKGAMPKSGMDHSGH